MYKKTINLAILFSVVLLAGCAGFKGNHLPIVNNSDIEVTSTTKTKVFTRWSIISESKLNEQVKVMHAAANKKAFEDALIRSNCCIIAEGPTEANVIIDGKAYAEDHTGGLIGAMISGFSFGIIPSWLTANPHVSADAVSGETKSSYEAKDSYTMVTWLPMIFAFPFANPFDAEKEVNENVFNNLILNMQKDGVFTR